MISQPCHVSCGWREVLWMAIATRTNLNSSGLSGSPLVTRAEASGNSGTSLTASASAAAALALGHLDFPYPSEWATLC